MDRGYTGHEHLLSVGLVHMNGRLYDPVLHRFLMPDDYVQDPYSTLSYNRYSYVLNNPLMYVDPSGEQYAREGKERPNQEPITFTPEQQRNISDTIEGWLDEITSAQYGRWFKGAIGKPVEKWVNKHIVNPIKNLFGGRSQRAPAPVVHMLDVPGNMSAAVPTNLSIFGPTGAGGISTSGSGLGISGADVADTVLDFVPIAGGVKDIYKGINEGNGWMVALGAGSIVLDVFTLGGSSLVKGGIKTGIKVGARSVASSAAKTSTKLLNQFNSAESLIQGAGSLAKVKAGMQGFVKGDGASIFKAISQGGTRQANGTILMQDGTTLFNHFSTKTGIYTIDINKAGSVFKIRVGQ
ncbi:RHS repeat-associated core domain-containing protein [Arenibacter sp. GZD96]|nr:RHS repeat-associated core domain-containing protein [Arenibacter sp. GZD-96]MEA1786483.1 RHS repeat-associated core domain-containing protein [Arenibacter sp. GZD-96]